MFFVLSCRSLASSLLYSLFLGRGFFFIRRSLSDSPLRIFRDVLLFICQGAKRRRRDLNPRAAINDLHPFQGCPFSLLGTSPGN